MVLLFLHNGFSQVFPAKNYPADYFQWPVAAKVGIAANFGELRPNHYHMGLDCRTDQKQNMPVLAAADGYIARVKIEPYGFGRAIYINHPNGLTTLYAHLNDFDSLLEAYVRQQQYKLESWRVFLDLPPNLFPVKQGQPIAWSGNTGGSQGPHLHFEIRNTQTDKVLNPLLFNFPIPDSIPPDIYKLAVYNRNLSIYEQSPQLLNVKKVNGIYNIVPGGLLKTNNDLLSFAINTYDRSTGSGNRNGIYEAVIYVDDKPMSGFQIDGIGYDETRYLNAHIDYKVRSSGGGWLEQLSRMPGYPPGVYRDFGSDGVIRLTDTTLHQVRIDVKDANGNTSVVQFGVKLNALPVVVDKPNSYRQPDEFHPGFVNILDNDRIRFYVGESCLYDSIRFRFSVTNPASAFPVYQLHSAVIPVHTAFPVWIKPLGQYDTSKMVLHRFSGGKHDFAKAVYENGWYRSSGFRDFGSYQLMVDTVPPVITPVGFKNGMNTAKLSSLRFVVTDNSEDLSFRAELDGKWLRFTNDKGRTFIYIFDEHCPPGEHELVIRATDQVGNTSERRYSFTR